MVVVHVHVQFWIYCLYYIITLTLPCWQVLESFFISVISEAR